MAPTSTIFVSYFLLLDMGARLGLGGGSSRSHRAAIMNEALSKLSNGVAAAEGHVREGLGTPEQVCFAKAEVLSLDEDRPSDVFQENITS